MSDFVLKFGNEFLNVDNSFESQIATLSDDVEAISAIDKAFIENDKHNELKLFHLVVNVFKTLNSLGIKHIDFGSHNLMEDTKGNIKMVDISDENDI